MRVTKKRSVVIFLGLTVFLVFLYGHKFSTSFSDKSVSKDRLVVYSPNSQTILRTSIPAFEEKYKVKVTLIQGSTGTLIERLKQNPKQEADVFFGGIYTLFDDNKRLFQAYHSKEARHIMADYAPANSVATPYAINGSVLLINTDLTKGMTIQSYQDLLNPELKGKIAYADPNRSSSAFSHLTTILLAKGGYENPKAWQFMETLVSRYGSRKPMSSSEVYHSVAEGKLAVGLTYEDPSLKLVNSGVNVAIVYPKEGTVFAPSSVAIVKGTKHLKNAQRFIDFIISKEMQATLGESTTNRPVRADIKLTSEMKSLSDITSLKEDYAYVTKHQDQMLKRYNAIVKQNH